MDSMMGSGGGSGDEQESSNPPNEIKSKYRHTHQQIELLEEFFKLCPHPYENQRIQLARELGLEAKQVKFWFQNKRTQTKVQIERNGNNVLRAANERIRYENQAIKEALKTVLCASCGGHPCAKEDHEHCLQELRIENTQLKEEYEKISNFLNECIGKSISQVEPIAPAPGPAFELSPGSFFTQRMGIDQDISSGSTISNSTALAYQFKGVKKEQMVEIAVNAMNELIRLLSINNPLWVKSAVDGRLVLHRDIYEEMFPKTNHLRSSSVHVESSKESGIVSMCGMQLVNIFLDSDKWVYLFPTIVTKAKTICVLETGLSSRTGALQLMYEQMHILSPLVPPREFYFLRHCQQVDIGTWVIVDVSYDCLQGNTSPSHCWRLPSGCIIHEMPNGCTKVTWVEHVEVDDTTPNHYLFRDLICSGAAYGAERWVFTLQRMSERFANFIGDNLPSLEPRAVIRSDEAKWSIMNLGHRMIKNFCGILNMSGMLDFPQLSDEVNNSEVRISVRENTEPGLPGGTVIIAAASLRLPLPPQNVLSFFKDEKNRVQWDVLSIGNPIHEIALISNVNHPGNCISTVRPFIATESKMLIFQESYTDPLGSLLVYAPIDVPALNSAVTGEDSSWLPVLPSGFIISGDGRTKIGAGPSTSTGAERSSGTLLTVVYQILISNPSSSKLLQMESVATVNALLNSTVQRIKSGLNCSFD